MQPLPAGAAARPVPGFRSDIAAGDWWYTFRASLRAAPTGHAPQKKRRRDAAKNRSRKSKYENAAFVRLRWSPDRAGSTAPSRFAFGGQPPQPNRTTRSCARLTARPGPPRHAATARVHHGRGFPCAMSAPARARLIRRVALSLSRRTRYPPLSYSHPVVSRRPYPLSLCGQSSSMLRERAAPGSA